MDRGAWWSTIHGVTKESDTTEMTEHTHRRTQLPPPYQLQASPWVHLYSADWGVLGGRETLSSQKDEGAGTLVRRPVQKLS